MTISNIIGNTLVVDTNRQASLDYAAVIGFKSILYTSTVTGANEDSDYPFSNCLDFRDNTQYSPSIASGSVAIEFNQTAISEIDYIGIGIHNGSTAGLTGTLEAFSDGAWVTVSMFTPLGDNKTIITSFNPLLSSRQRLTLNFTGKIFIGNIYIGKSWVFDKTPNTGFIPGHTNSLDKLESFDSETNQFIMGRVIKRGFNQKGNFDFVPWADDVNGFESQYVDYMNHVKAGKAVFMKWNTGLQQNFFGRASNPNSLQSPSYVNNQSGTFYFDYKGFA